MAKKILTTPIKAEDLEDIHIGDIIYLNGHITTCRDVAHRRLIEGKRELPVNLEGGAIFHAGPIVRPVEGEEDKYEMVSVGPTTSMRMEKFEYDFIRETGIKLIVGKGGMKEGTMRGCQEYKALHCVFPAGCAVVAAATVEEIESADWKDLGMAGATKACQGPCGRSVKGSGRESRLREGKEPEESEEPERSGRLRGQGGSG